MAEIAAGAIAAEQVVSTTAEAGVAYAVARPSMPLKASFTQISPLKPDGTKYVHEHTFSPATENRLKSPSASHRRANHSITVIGNRAYLFGGTVDTWERNNEVCSFGLFTEDEAKSDYLDAAQPTSLPDGGHGVPKQRMKHSACALNGKLVVYGGTDSSGGLLQDATMWLYDVQRGAWDTLKQAPETAAPSLRSEAKLFPHSVGLILYGGKNEEGSSLADTWLFNTSTDTWHRLPDAPAATTNAALVDGVLYIISGNDNLSSSLHYLNTAPGADEQPSWETITFPTNPLAPGPGDRQHGGLAGISTGYGRNYLLYFLGERKTSGKPDDASTPNQWSDMWTFQLPSSNVELKSASIVSEAIKPAKIKDFLRSKFGAESGTYTWAEVELKPPGDLTSEQGKIHPGPRSSFGYDVLPDGHGVVLWGGIDARGEIESDSWVVRIE